jgi:hypothetical protein
MLARSGDCSFATHVFDRMIERSIGADDALKELTLGDIKPAIEPGRDNDEWR